LGRLENEERSMMRRRTTWELSIRPGHEMSGKQDDMIDILTDEGGLGANLDEVFTMPDGEEAYVFSFEGEATHAKEVAAMVGVVGQGGEIGLRGPILDYVKEEEQMRRDAERAGEIGG
jgi:hypothetical protein